MVKKQRVVSDDENDAHDSGPSAAERGLTLDTFTDRGFGSGGKSAEYAAKIKQLQGECNRNKNKIEISLEQLQEVAVVLYEADLLKKDFDTIDAAFKESLDELAVIKLRMELLEDVRAKISEDDDMTYSSIDFLKRSGEKEDAYRKLAPKAKYAKSKHYKTFRERVWETEHAPAPMPPLSTLLPKVKSEPGAGEESDSDDELETGGVTQNFKDPLTYTLLQEPMTSTVCPHSFSKASILEYLTGNATGEKECPNAGCKAMLSRATLKEDKELGKRVAAFERREERLREEREREGGEGEELLSDEEE